MLIIVSAAKTLNMQPLNLPIGGTLPLFDEDAERIANLMRKYSVDELGKLFGTSQTLSEATFQNFLNFDDRENPTKEALFAYAGSVFQNIEPTTFDADDLRYAQKIFRILSPLYGVLAPMNLIKAYRMEFPLKIMGIDGSMYDYWRDKITDNILAEAKKNDKTIVILGSKETSRAIDFSKLGSEINVITPAFKEFRKGKYVGLATYEKICRGRMSQFIIRERISSVDELKDFHWNGYSFNEDLSDNNNFIFTKD